MRLGLSTCLFIVLSVARRLRRQMGYKLVALPRSGAILRPPGYNESDGTGELSILICLNTFLRVG